VAESRESQFQALLADAQEDPDVVGVFLFGSRSREGFVDERSDYDIGVVVTDGEGALAAFDERWPYAHGAGVEIASTTLSGLRSGLHSRSRPASLRRCSNSPRWTEETRERISAGCAPTVSA
jgi:predicted nucleotidyltransferase